MMLRRMPTRLGTEQNEICELDEIRKKMRLKYEMEDVASAGAGADSTVAPGGKAAKTSVRSEALHSSGALPPPTRHQRLGLTRPAGSASGAGSAGEQSGHGLRQ